MGVLNSSRLAPTSSWLSILVAQHLILSFASHILQKRPALISVTYLHNPSQPDFFSRFLCDPRLVSTVVTMHNPLTEQTFSVLLSILEIFTSSF